jgi:hypothetical protein
MILFKVLTKKKIVKDSVSQFVQIANISCAILYEIIIVRLDYYKFCERCFPKMLMGAYEMQRVASFSFDILKRYHEDGGFLNHIARVTGEETILHFVNCSLEVTFLNCPCITESSASSS